MPRRVDTLRVQACPLVLHTNGNTCKIFLFDMLRNENAKFIFLVEPQCKVGVSKKFLIILTFEPTLYSQCRFLL